MAVLAALQFAGRDRSRAHSTDRLPSTLVYFKHQFCYIGDTVL